VDGCLLGGRSAAIDPRVVRDEIGIHRATMRALPPLCADRAPLAVLSLRGHRSGTSARDASPMQLKRHAQIFGSTARPVSNIWRSLAVPAAPAARGHAMHPGFVRWRRVRSGDRSSERLWCLETSGTVWRRLGAHR
jgi:hypothetical protein